MKTKETRVIIALLAMLILLSQAGFKTMEAGSFKVPSLKNSQASIQSHSPYDHSYARSCTGTAITGMQGVLYLVQRTGSWWQERNPLVISLISALLTCLLIIFYVIFLMGSQPRKEETAICTISTHRMEKNN